jgi:tryptophan halogenase
MSRPIEKVVVVGRDAAAWLTAFGLQRAFGRVGVEVHLIELGSVLSPADAYVAIPPLAGLHGLLGLDERAVIAACQGVYAIGQRFANWAGGRAPFLHAYDTQPVGLNNVDLLQYWVKARAEGLTLEFEEFSLGAAMAKHGKVLLDGAPTQGFSRPAHGYHLDASSYVRLLRSQAIGAGVKWTTGGVRDVRIEGERISEVVLDDGQAITADLFVDASGGQAALIGRLPGAEMQSWRPWFGCDRILSASAKRLEPLPGFSQIAAIRVGWAGLYPLQYRTAVVAAYDSAQMADQDLPQVLSLLTGVQLEGDAVVSALEPGIRSPWIGNCVAVGEAAISLDPLDGLALHVIHTGLSHLISLFPLDADDQVEAKAYNAGMGAHARNMRDFQIAHYKLNRRFDEVFWDRARDMAIPETLAYKIGLFEARGRIALYDDETFQESNWTSLFVGHGLTPRDFDPLVDKLPRDEQILQLQRMLQFIAGEVNQMPSLASQLGPRGPSFF